MSPVKRLDGLVDEVERLQPCPVCCRDSRNLPGRQRVNASRDHAYPYALSNSYQTHYPTFRHAHSWKPLVTDTPLQPRRR